jgi:hypothetical protein
MSVRITCITKDNGNHLNPHEGISELGWINEETRASGRSTRLQMIEFIERQNGVAYVKDGNGNIAYVGVVNPGLGRNKYLRTHADGKWTDNLLSCNEC